jgi:hypothetical protein
MPGEAKKDGAKTKGGPKAERPPKTDTQPGAAAPAEESQLLLLQEKCAVQLTVSLKSRESRFAKISAMPA